MVVSTGFWNQPLTETITSDGGRGDPTLGVFRDLFLILSYILLSLSGLLLVYQRIVFLITNPSSYLLISPGKYYVRNIFSRKNMEKDYTYWHTFLLLFNFPNRGYIFSKNLSSLFRKSFFLPENIFIVIFVELEKRDDFFG